MSTHLLPIGKGDDTPVYYRQIKSTDDIMSIFTYEHNRMLYIGILFNDRTKFQLSRIDLLTNQFVELTTIPRPSIGNFYMCGMVVDDDYVYMTTPGNSQTASVLYRIDLSTYEINTFTPSSSDWLGPISVYNDTTLVTITAYGFVFFDTISGTFYTKKQSTVYDNYAVTVGKNIVMNHTTTSTILLYRIKQDAINTFTLPYDRTSVSCYNNGFFYIAQSNYLYIFDEETESIKSSLVVPWSNPTTINYTNGALFVTQANSNILFVYNLDKKKYKQIVLPWTVPDIWYGDCRQPTAFKGYYFLPDTKLCIVDCTNNAKYNLGYKFDQFTFIFNAKLKDEYTFDENFVSFKDSYLTINDGDIKLTPTIVDTENKIKKVHVNKSQYTKIKSISYEVS